jgi:hypothetical protein
MKKPLLPGELERWRLPSYDQAREARREAHRQRRRNVAKETMKKLRENRQQKTRQAHQEALRRERHALAFSQKNMGDMAAKRYDICTLFSNSL